MINVSILGHGNVGKRLLMELIAAEGVKVREVFSPSLQPRIENGINYINTVEGLSKVDIYILAVNDDAIRMLSAKLPFEGRLVVHTSGTVSLEAIDPKNRRGVFYPLQTFSEGADLDFKSIPICIEAELKSDEDVLQQLGHVISNKVTVLKSDDRKKLHLAAVWVNNFTNHIFQLAEEYLIENNLSFDLLRPLILETAQKVQMMSPSKAQTGPAKRKDEETIQAHLEMMKDPQHKEIYKLLTESIKERFD